MPNDFTLIRSDSMVTQVRFTASRQTPKSVKLVKFSDILTALL